jgi:putative ABC transport system permease protein
MTRIARDARTAGGRRAAAVYVCRELRDLLRLSRDLRRDAPGRGPVHLNQTSEKMPMIQAVAADIRWACRLARRRPAFASAVVATLGLTIAAAATAFGLASAVLWKPLPFADPSRLVLVWERVAGDQASQPGRVTAGRFTHWRDHQSSFTSMAAFGAAGFTMAGPEGTVMVRGVRVTSNYFDTLGIAPALGRSFLPSDEVPGQHRVVVLSHAFWQQWFGGRPDAAGATLHLSGEAYTVIGVMPPVVFPGWPVNPATVTLDPDARQFWVPIPAAPQWAGNARAHVHGVVARLRPGVSMAQAADDLNRLTSSAAADPHGAHVTPFREQFVRDARLPLLMLVGTTVAVLLVACANLAALQVSATESRRAEFGIRTALGAGRVRLARQLATESLLLAALGGIAGAGLARLALTSLPALLPPTIPFLTAPALDLRVAAFGAGVALVSGIMLGLWPVVRSIASSPSPRGTTFAARTAVYRSLVVVQVSLATALAVAASLLAQSLGAVTRQDAGFVLDGILVAEVAFSGPAYREPAAVSMSERRLIGALSAIPGVSGAATAYDHPLEANWTDSFVLTASSPAQDDVRWSAQLRIVSPGYFETMGVEVVAGRGFSERDDLEAAGALMVNEAFVRSAGAEVVLGRRVRSAAPRFSWGNDAPTDFQIVGVVENERFRGLEEPSQPAVYMSTRQFPQQGFSVLVRTAGDPLASAASLRAAVRAVDATAPVERVTSLADILAEQLVARRATTDVIGGLAGAALALAALGLYGLLAMIVSSRTREIGVRLALGALPGQIARQVVGDSLRSALAGVGAGIVLALFAGRLLQRLLVGVTASDATTIGTVSLALIAVAGLAAFVPALRAARIDPARALRFD